VQYHAVIILFEKDSLGISEQSLCSFGRPFRGTEECAIVDLRRWATLNCVICDSECSFCGKEDCAVAELLLRVTPKRNLVAEVWSLVDTRVRSHG